MRNLYAVLGLQKDASQLEIKNAYRKLAIKFHPDKHPPKDKGEVEKVFQEISEAYSILSDEEQKQLYDLNDSQGKQYKNNQKFDAKEAFENFFKDDNPFTHCRINFHDTKEFHSKEKKHGKENIVKRAKMGDVIINLNYTLEDIYCSKKKIAKVTRKRMSSSHQLQDDIKLINIQACPDWTHGAKLKYENEGDESIDQTPGNLIFKLKESKHDTFHREGSNLIYVAKITLLEALVQCTLNIPTIDGGSMVIHIPEVIHCNYERRISGAGMPSGVRTKRGDFIIRFDIQFPRVIKDDVRLQLRKLLLLT